MEPDNWAQIIAEVNDEICRITGKPLNEPQKQALKAILKSRKGTVQMPTGCGKTRLVSAFILALVKSQRLVKGDNVLFFTPRVVLRKQAVIEEFRQVLSSHALRIKEIEGTEFFQRRTSPWERLGIRQTAREMLRECLTDSSNITVCVLTPHAWSSYYRRLGLSHVERIRVFIGDEGHYYYGGREIYNSIEGLADVVYNNSGYVIALTATPVKDTVELFGPILYRLSSLRAMQIGILTSEVRIYPYVTHTIVHRTNLSDASSAEWRVAVKQRAEKYASLIVETLRDEAIKNGFSIEKRVPKTLVVAANTAEASILAESLRKTLDRYGKGNTVYEAHTGIESDNQEKESHRRLADFKKSKEGIIVTVDMARLGFDDKNLEVLVIARKISSPTAYIQLRGRVLRRPDADFCIKKSDNGKGGYAVIVNLHYDRDFESELERIEQWNLESLEQGHDLNRGLSGFGKGVQVVEGEVKITQLDPRIITTSTMRHYLIHEPLIKEFGFCPSCELKRLQHFDAEARQRIIRRAIRIATSLTYRLARHD